MQKNEVKIKRERIFTCRFIPTLVFWCMFLMHEYIQFNIFVCFFKLIFILWTGKLKIVYNSFQYSTIQSKSNLFDLLPNEMPVLSIVSVLMFSLLCKQPVCDNGIVVVFCVIMVVVRNEIFNFLNTFSDLLIYVNT